MVSEQEKAELQIALDALWHRGEIRGFLLDANQLEASRDLWASNDDCVVLWSRRLGKSYWAVVECVSLALSKPGQLIKYAAKTQLSVVEIIEPIMRQVLESCPKALQPAFDFSAKKWTFKNGSEIKAAGVDGDNYERLRGTGANFIVRDEAAFWDKYEEADSVLSPQLLTTKGIMLDITTPPENLGHPFVARYHAAKSRGRALHRTIYDNPRITRNDIDGFLFKEAAKRGQTLEEFKASTYFRREYLCEFVTEESRAALPSWTLEKQQLCVREMRRPEWFDAYVAFDIGFGDPHGVLFAFWDFKTGLLVIEDEIFIRQANSDDVAAMIRQKEGSLWGVSRYEGTLMGSSAVENLPTWLKQTISEKAPRQPYLRVIDAPQVVVSDILTRHGMAFIPTRKDNKHAAVDEMDSMVNQEQVIINPRCINLIRQMHSTTWNKARTEWERNADGHGDLVDSLNYLCRNVRKHRNPIPAGTYKEDPWLKALQEKPKKEAFERMLRPRRRM